MPDLTGFLAAMLRVVGPEIPPAYPEELVCGPDSPHWSMGVRVVDGERQVWASNAERPSNPNATDHDPCPETVAAVRNAHA